MTENGNASSGDKTIQVPDSSPVAESRKLPLALNSLRNEYSFKPVQPSQESRPKLSLDVKKNFSVLRKKFPERETKAILQAIKLHPNLRDASKYISELPPVVKPAVTSNPVAVVTPVKSKPEPVVDVLSSSPVKTEDDSPVKSMKVDLKRPAQSITQKYFKRLHLSNAANANDDPLASVSLPSLSDKRRRLIRGYRRSSSSESEHDLIKVPSTEASATPETTQSSTVEKKPEILMIVDDDEEENAVDDDSDDDVVEMGYNDVEGFEDKVLEFLNTAEKRDIVDIASITPAIANVFIERRPFVSLDEIEDQNFTETELKKPKKGRRKPTGLKIVESATNRLRGYNAVESLISKCSAYSASITEEIQKWGVGVKGEEGELEIVEVDVDSADELPDEPDLSVATEDDHQSVLLKRQVPAKTKPEDSSDEEDYDDEDEDDEDRIVVKQTKRERGHYTGYFKRKPKLLASSLELKGYQQVGLNWLNLLYEKELSCILADEMGLGKTVQVIAFLAHLKQKGYSGPHLVVVPSSTLENWLREFQKFCPEMIVQPYYGSQSERQSLRYDLEDSSTYDVLVTTYNLATGNKYDQAFLRSRDFNVVVYDEGHMLKNSSSDRYTKLMKISADFRLLLTGTPLQNNLKELISLLAFILPNLFNAKKDDLAVLFGQKASSKIEEGEEDFNPLLAQQAIANAKTMMTPFVLRRKKSQVMKHLPEKRQFIEYCDMMEDQTEIYQKQIEVVRQAREAREEHRKQAKGALSRNAFPLKVPSAANLLMQLRKAVLHPLLFRHIFDDETIKTMSKQIMKEPEYVTANEEYIYEDMGVMSDFELQRLCQKFPKTLSKFELNSDVYLRSGKIQKLKELLHEIIVVRGERLLLFSLFTQMLDILESVLSVLGIKFLRLDGQTAVETRQVIIDKFYSDEEIPVFLLSTRAGGFGINLVCANNVIIFDQSFNPHDDKQAEDRAHRVGQEKEVNVYRLITRNTVEENIWSLAQNKLQLDSSMSGDGEDTKFEERAAKMVEGMLFKDGDVAGGVSEVKETEVVELD